MKRSQISKRSRPWCLTLLSLAGILLTTLPGWAVSEISDVTINHIAVSGQTANVDAYVSVLDDGGRAISGLPTDAFTLLEDSVPVEAQITEQQVGLVVMLLVDLSGSMTEPGVVEGQTRLDSVSNITDWFLRSGLDDDDLAGVTGFNVETVYFRDFTPDHGAVQNDIAATGANPHANTALLNTANGALDRLHNAGEPVRRKVLVIFSDGKDDLEETDPVVYQETREAVARKAKEYGIPIYTVGVDSYCSQKGVRARCVRLWPENAYEAQDVAWLADQTGGGYIHYGGQDADSKNAEAVRSFLSGVASQGGQYHVSYPTHAGKGQHQLLVQVTSGTESAGDGAIFYAPFELPTIRITVPPAGYTLDLATGTIIHVETEVSFPDNRSRDLDKVIYYDGSSVVTTTLTGPSHAFDWDVSNLEGSHTLRAEAFDSVIRDRTATSDPVTVGIIPLPTPTPTPTPIPPIIETPPSIHSEGFWSNFWRWLINTFGKLLPFVLVIAVIVMFLIILTLRRQIAKGIKKTTTWVKRQTAVLTGREGGQTLAKLIGPAGIQYRISGRYVTFGSDETVSSEIIPNDRFISGKHFSIIKETDSFYIMDEYSRNNTYLNGIQLAPGQKMPLADGAYIRAGQTDLQFRIGDVTTALT